MRRLLITACSAGSGGGEVALLRHLDHSSLDAGAVTVALLNDGPLVGEIASRGIRCEVLGRPQRGGEFPGPKETWLIAWQLARLSRLVGATRTLAYTVPDLRAVLAARLFRCLLPFWRSQGEVTIFARNGPDVRGRRLVSSAIRHGVRVIASTCWDADALVAWGLAPADVRSVGYGVDDGWFDPPEREKGLDDRPFRIAFSGRLVRWKGQHVLLEALARLDRAGDTDWEAWVIGGGEAGYRASLETFARASGLSDRVRFLGHVANPRDMVAQCDVLVHASEREPFGLVLAEAMALGVPVVASDTAGPREIIRPGETGWLVAVGDADGLARRLSTLMRNPASLETVAARAHADVDRRYRARRCIAELESLVFDDSRWGPRARRAS